MPQPSPKRGFRASRMYWRQDDSGLVKRCWGGERGGLLPRPRGLVSEPRRGYAAFVARRQEHEREERAAARSLAPRYPRTRRFLAASGTLFFAPPGTRMVLGGPKPHRYAAHIYDWSGHVIT